MRFFSYFILTLFITLIIKVSLSQETVAPDFSFGNVSYFNLSVGEKVAFNQAEIEILGLDHHYTRIRVNLDTVWLKVARRSYATKLSQVQLFVADNRAVKSISGNSPVHGLLIKDVLLAVAPSDLPLADPLLFNFPVSFTQGFLWRMLEDTYMFSYQAGLTSGGSQERSFAGIGIDMRDTRAMEKHLILAMENGRIVWIENYTDTSKEPLSAVCIQSESAPSVYYVYEHLRSNGLMVRRNQRILKGEGIGFAWGTGGWNCLRLGIVRSDSIPSYSRRHYAAINFYPQLLDLYFGSQPVYSHSFTKGQIYFGRPEQLNGNAKNVSDFEEFHGTGWKLGSWNTAGKVEWVPGRRTGNARLRKTLFKGEPAECTNPDDWYEFEINVRNGVYRIRALVGDQLLPSWQKLEYEGVVAGTFRREPGDLVWTSERIVKVNDGKLTVRIYTDGDQAAGISEIVFQQAAL